MGLNNRNRNFMIDENYSTLTNHSKTTIYNTLTSCNQLRKINIKDKMRKKYFIGIEDIKTCILFYIMYCFVSRKALKMAVLSLRYLQLNSGIFDCSVTINEKKCFWCFDKFTYTVCMKIIAVILNSNKIGHGALSFSFSVI
jgi:hypothetical protein